jgi:ABC-type uncharacterized transport system permease subunit
MSNEYKAIACTLFKVFLAACLAQIIASDSGVLDLGADGLKAVVGAGISAVVIAGYNYINPRDTRYGFGYDDGAPRDAEITE